MILAEKIQLLRRIDSLIDFNRATAQLKILITLNNDVYSVDEITKRTGLKRKTVLDAIRKLEIKGLVEKYNNKYRLSELGKNIYNALLNLAGTSYKDIPTKPSFKTIYYETYDQLLNVVYMLQVVREIGNRGNKPIYIRDLARRLNVSQVTLSDHIRRFTVGELKIFEKIYDVERRRTYYRLTDTGLKLYCLLYGRRKRKTRSLTLILILLVLILTSIIEWILVFYRK